MRQRVTDSEDDVRAVTAGHAEWRLLLGCCEPMPRREALTALLRGPLNWSLVLALAQAHGVTGHMAALLAPQFAALVPQEAAAELQRRRRQRLLFTLGMTAELFRLAGILADAGIETVVTKGPVLSMQAYGDPGLRDYADLDLLVRHADAGAATRALMNTGYEPKVPLRTIEAGRIPREYLFAKPGTRQLADLHTERTLRYFPRVFPIEEVFARKICVCLDGHNVPALSAEDELVLIAIHGAKHFWERLMWVADVAALAGRQPLFDWDRAARFAQAVGAERMLHMALCLAVRLLNAPLPQAVLQKTQQDKAALELAARAERWLPAAGSTQPGLMDRARFRVQMRRGFFSGASYLFRLSLSPTEKDWVAGDGRGLHRLWEAAGRPFRLARKYRRER